MRGSAFAHRGYKLVHTTMKKLFTSEVTSKGGRSGSVAATDGTIETKLGNPLDASSAIGPNPETFLAAAYSACFHGALQNAAKTHNAALKDSTVTVRVSLNEDDAGGYFLSIQIIASMPGIGKDLQEKILSTAHQTCPYSKLARGDATVELRAI